MRILHFSDIHVWDLGRAWEDCFYPKRCLGFLNLVARRRRRFPPEYAEAVVGEIHAQDADLVVFSGDLTTQSTEAEFRRCAALFAPLHRKWGEQFFVIPGNHDRYTPGSVRRGAYETYFPYAAFPPGGAPVRSVELNDGALAVVGLDNSRPFMIRSNGTFTEAAESALRAELQRHADHARDVILVGHFPYASPVRQRESWGHRLLGADRLRSLVARFKPRFYLHGHRHSRWLIRPPATPETVCVDSGSAGMRSANPARQAGFVALELDATFRLVGAIARVLGDDGTFTTLRLAESSSR